MRKTSIAASLVLAVLPTVLPGIAFAQASSPPATPRAESVQDFINRLSAEQKQKFQNAQKSFSEQRYADALALCKQLLGELPGDVVLSKLASEPALNSGDTSFALNVVKPVAQADPDDWQAAELFTRECAEAGDVSCRNDGIAHMRDLHRRSITPPNMQRYILERVKVNEKILLIWMSLEHSPHSKRRSVRRPHAIQPSRRSTSSAYAISCFSLS